MTWIDVVLLIVILGSAVSAFRNGFTRELVGIVSVIAALLLGAWFYGLAGSYLVPWVSSRSVSNLLGFLLVFCGVLLLGSLVGRVLRGFMKVTGLSFLDRLLGAAFGAVRGILVSVALVMAVMAFTPARRMQSSVAQSRIAPYVVDAARGCTAMAPYELRQGFRRSYEEVKSVVKRGLPQEASSTAKRRKENK